MQIHDMLCSYTASIIQDLIQYIMLQKTNKLFGFMINTFVFVQRVRKNKKNVNVRVNRKLKLTTPKYATKNKLIVCFNNSCCFIFLR